VLMSAIFGTSFATIIDAKKSYNHNVFYIYTGDAETSDKLNDALGKSESGIDYLRLFYDYYYQSGNQYISFYMGNFESFQVNSYEYDFSTNAVFMDVTAAKDLSVVTGSKELNSDYEILITTAVADALLEKSGLGHISKYKDLIGLLTSSLYIDGNSLRVVGIVQADEPAIYLSELALAKHINEMNPILCQLAPSNMQVATGTAVMLFRTYSGGAKLPKEGDTIQIHGMDIQISKIISIYNSYPEWLAGNKINKPKDENAYFSQILKEEKPQLSPDSDEFLHEVDKMVNERYYEYLDYYYSELDTYLLEYHIMEGGSMEAWLAVEKGLVDAKFNFTEHEDYYKAFKYKEMYGKYPSRTEMKQLAPSLPELNDTMNRYYKMYEEEYYNSQSYGYYGEHAYLMNERDFITMSRRVGITDNSAIPLYYSSVDERCYTMIHSVNPELTEKWIAENLKDHESPTEYLPAVVTPDHLYEDIMANNKVVILSSFITMAVILTVMSICMYFIMRSSLMSRIKEIGIYRAIGVSKKNLVFKFIVEALVLTTLTVFIGYLATSAFMAACLALSPMVETVFFYPLWLALAVLVILYALCLFCGTLPITLLLRKTPSEILAKYDI